MSERGTQCSKAKEEGKEFHEKRKLSASLMLCMGQVGGEPRINHASASFIYYFFCFLDKICRKVSELRVKIEEEVLEV